METVGAFIRRVRLERKISLRKLARLVGISATYLSHIEIDHVPAPSPDKLDRIAHELQLDLTDLLQRAGRWDQRAAEVIGSKPALRDLFHLAFAMDDAEIHRLVEEIERRLAIPREPAGLL